MQFVIILRLFSTSSVRHGLDVFRMPSCLTQSNFLYKAGAGELSPFDCASFLSAFHLVTTSVSRILTSFRGYSSQSGASGGEFGVFDRPSSPRVTWCSNAISLNVLVLRSLSVAA